MTLIRPTKEQFSTLENKLERAGLRPTARTGAGRPQTRVLYQILSSLGFEDARSPGARALAPNYAEVGMTRKAGAPTKAEIDKYAEVTGGGEITDKGLVVQGLLFDTDLITDRYAVVTLNTMVDLYDKYLGRANDFDHSFDITHARCRIIELGLGSDSEVKLHKDTPSESLATLSPANPYSKTYLALYATLAFPDIANDPYRTIDSIKSGVMRDISIAWGGGCSYCSVCLNAMESFYCWNYCEEHGFPGGRTEDGTAVVEIKDGAADAFTFGLVSDGAVKRAMLVLDPTAAKAGKMESSASAGTE